MIKIITDDELSALRAQNSKRLDELKVLADSGIMPLDKVEEQIAMTRKEIIKAHEEKYSIWQGTGEDKRWKTRLPDGKLKAKANRADLEDLIVKFYTSPSKMTVQDLYNEWIEYKKAEARTSSYIAKIKSDWRTYYKTDEDFIKKDVLKLTTIDMELWANGIIKKYNMTKKVYYNTSMIIRQSLKYAKKKGYIDKSPFDEAEINTRLFVKERKAKSETQVYTLEEQERMEIDMWQLYEEKPEYTAPLAIILLFYTGLRCGELVALKTTDIEGDYIHVQRQEVRVFEDVDAEHSKMVGYQIVEYTKSEDGDRLVPIVGIGKEIINLVMSINEENGWWDDDFLFVHGNRRIKHGAIEGRIVDACDRLGIRRKTAHKFRKTYISTLYDNGLPLEAIRKIVGHADDRTTLRNYCFNRLTDDQTYERIELALAKPQKSVTECNTKIVEFPRLKKCGKPA